MEFKSFEELTKVDLTLISVFMVGVSTCLAAIIYRIHNYRVYKKNLKRVYLEQVEKCVGCTYRYDEKTGEYHYSFGKDEENGA